MGSFLPDQAELKHVDIFACLADGIFHETTVENIKDVVPPTFTSNDLQEYVSTFTKPSDIPKFKEVLLECINTNTTKATQLFIVLTTILDSRILAPTLTNSMTLVKDMTIEERENLLKSWRDSPISTKRRLFRMVSSLTLNMLMKIGNDLHFKAINYPKRDLNDKAYDSQVIDPFRYQFLSKPKYDDTELYLPDIDVLVIGSGAGAGVVAHTLANDGYKSLVLEKGRYFHNSELNFEDLEGMKELYQSGGVLGSRNQQIFVLAGSTFGGGTTVNWSACLKTPFKVRKEWFDEFGLDFAANESYDINQQYVWDQMGASTENITHSLANKVLLEGGQKLGYKSKEIEQNTGGHLHHPCGFCYLGCKYGIKQGSLVSWFRDAAQNGSQFMDQVRVLQILHKDGKAVGVLCQDEETNVKFKITGFKKLVVSGGSLNTPVILKNSGFKNKNIGKNLTLHPVTTIYGDFGKDVQANHSQKSIMTSVCTQVDDLDGKAHGAKIETILNAPFIQSALLPWRSSDEARKDLLRYNNMIAMLLITRDKSSGSVEPDPNRPEALYINYKLTEFDKNALLQAFLVTADILYIEGAKRILSSQARTPIFESNKPKDSRSILDEDYVEWRKIAAKIPLDDYNCAYGSAHQMSSCRMSGKGPKYGACDTKGKLFEATNIYIADSSCMPTASGANPMITTMTIARHVALGILDDLKVKPKL